jgi:hypothetical protein
MTYLKVGEWDIRANGIHGTLHICEIDELGRVWGTFLDARITGWWSERARRLTFVRDRTTADALDEQGFEGYAWDELLDPSDVRVYYLAGSYQTFGGGGGAKDRQSFGWFAMLADDHSSARAGVSRLSRLAPALDPG